MPALAPRFILVAAFLLALAGCTSPPADTAGGSGGQITAASISGIPLPQDMSIDNDRSIILGGSDQWTGRLSYTVTTSADDMFSFFRREMPGFGWTELTAARADTSAMTFRSDSTGRIATILLSRRTIRGSRIDLVISAADGGMGSAPRAPRSTITSQPLR